MEQTPLFSVLIANYNNGCYLQEAIDSVLAQDYKNWEIVIVDDKSTDSSSEIYDRYKDDDRFHVYYNELNFGAGYTKHKCAEMAKGEICGFVDPDDKLAVSDALSTMVNTHLQNPDVFLCMSEHEGFCVPLLEAMASGLPIMAYAAAAVPETLGEKGVLIQNKDYNEIAKQIGRITKDDAYRKQIIDYQYENLRRFDIDVTKKKLLQLVASVSDRGKAP